MSPYHLHPLIPSSCNPAPQGAQHFCQTNRYVSITSQWIQVPRQGAPAKLKKRKKYKVSSHRLSLRNTTSQIQSPRASAMGRTGFNPFVSETKKPTQKSQRDPDTIPVT